MQTVGPKRHRAPLVVVSSAKAAPMRYAISVSKVEAIAQAAGKQAAVVPIENEAPRAPLGPSENLTLGMPLDGIELVVQRSLPLRRRI